MRRFRKAFPALLLISPSLILVGIFVYGFLGWNLRVSFTSWQGFAPTYDFVGFENYAALMDDPIWWRDVRHVLVFTLVFVAGALAVGFLLALLMEKGVRGENLFRSVYLFPMAISFIATAIIWRGLLNNGSGDSTAGINKLFAYAGLGFLHSDWHKSDSGWAIAAIALPAGWALSGYIMALFLAGMRGVPDELREAARVDGAGEVRVFWHVVRPMLWPTVMSAVVILAHISLKTFDLMFAIDQRSPRIETPALYMYHSVFPGNFYARGATIATVLVLGIAVIIVPYIWYTMRAERRR
ncbi:carbohydrate ABC transporter membrane protein 1, CUT1 family (TC 3.A.1.1.-) [Stackebrandtia albiflava]|uniref:Carbohydrate ABC transporter membrane protein 1, CUT1 family (TC 3.A.1.1.-) n=1 Tax=Stackebrandtia albiflava TaxID=406432 RepID=A0A562UR35_9ACTN|nr:sugar ABC transporter permease [Stackebrandtia albiflava]TWJ08083.1 carbohydrate ABC transporter membrane protein 1, CUT1 family (TC 3.A.1.1.-) [Stackebrandtia albiflava]